MDHLVPQAVGSRVCTNEALFQATSARFGCPELLVWQFHHAICRPENGLHRLNLLTEARRVLVLPSLNLLTEARRGVRRDEAQCSSMFPRRGAMQQHLKSHAATCTEQSHWLHSGYAVVTTSVTLDTRSNNTDKSGRQTANATKHMQQQHERLFVVAVAPPKNVYSITTLSKRARKVSPDEVSALHTDSSSEDHCVEMNLPWHRCINHESRFRVSPAQPRLD